MAVIISAALLPICWKSLEMQVNPPQMNSFAGDKDMTNPELNAYALRKLKDQVKDIEVGYSNSRTCEMGLQHNSGIPYVSIIYLVNACTGE